MECNGRILIQSDNSLFHRIELQWNPSSSSNKKSFHKVEPLLGAIVGGTGIGSNAGLGAGVGDQTYILHTQMSSEKVASHDPRRSSRREQSSSYPPW